MKWGEWEVVNHNSKQKGKKYLTKQIIQDIIQA